MNTPSKSHAIWICGVLLMVALLALSCEAETDGPAPTKQPGQLTPAPATPPTRETPPVTRETVITADEHPLGYETALAAGMLSTDARARMAALPLQDLIDRNAGRYTLMSDDGISGHWGLDAIRARCEVGPKPAAALVDADGVLQTERVIFADTGTGATMMMLTRIPYQPNGPGDQLNYFGKACWSADGAHMLWVRDAKAGLWGPSYQKTTDEFGPLRVNADGTGATIVFRDVAAMKPPICSPTQPDVAYAWTGGNILELDLRTGTVRKTVGSMQFCWHLKVSPDGKYVLNKTGPGFRVLATAEDKAWDVKLDEREPGRSHSVHDSYRFLPADTDWIMYWYETSHPGGGLGKEGFRLRNFKTGAERIVPFRFDWNHGDVGLHFGFHCTPYVTAWNAREFTFEPRVGLAWPSKTWTDAGPWYSQPHSTGGYAAHWPDDQRWAYCCIYIHDKPGQAYLSEVSRIFAKPLDEGGRVNRFRICYNNLWGRTDRWGNPSVGLMRPNMSPDGTKLLFNSNVFCRDGVFMVVCARPMAPTDVTVAPRDAGVEVRWKAPRYHAEIAGYHVYRSETSGRGFRQITTTPVADTSFVDLAGDARTARFYTVRSVERSGLESSLSDDALAGPIGASPLAVFCEAERAISADLDAPSPDALWVSFEGLASDLYYIWQRRPDRPGVVKLPVTVRRAGKYTVVARMKGKDGAAFTIAGQDVSAPASMDWTWVRSADAAELAAGAHTVEIASSKYGSCLDCFYLAEARDFDPAGRIIAPKPARLALSAEAHASGVKLSWTGAKSPRWSHYNLYVSDGPRFVPGQSTLLASPDRESCLDWQLKPGQKCWYAVTQVTRDGVESAPSGVVTLEP